jgi:hypothetical protein
MRTPLQNLRTHALTKCYPSTLCMARSNLFQGVESLCCRHICWTVCTDRKLCSAVFVFIQYIHCKNPTLVSQPIPSQPPSADTHTQPDNDIMVFFSDDKPFPWCLPREYWMIYRGPSFLAVAWFGSSPTPPPPLSRHQAVLSFSGFLPSIEIPDGRPGEGVSEEANHTTAGKPWPL